MIVHTYTTITVCMFVCECKRYEQRDCMRLVCTCTRNECSIHEMFSIDDLLYVIVAMHSLLPIALPHQS
jgi:hypothetical protein